MTKRFISMVLALSMLLSLTPVSAFADTGGGIFSVPPSNEELEEQNDTAEGATAALTFTSQGYPDLTVDGVKTDGNISYGAGWHYVSANSGTEDANTLYLEADTATMGDGTALRCNINVASGIVVENARFGDEDTGISVTNNGTIKNSEFDYCTVTNNGSIHNCVWTGTSEKIKIIEGNGTIDDCLFCSDPSAMGLTATAHTLTSSSLVTLKIANVNINYHLYAMDSDNGLYTIGTIKATISYGTVTTINGVPVEQYDPNFATNKTFTICDEDIVLGTGTATNIPLEIWHDGTDYGTPKTAQANQLNGKYWGSGWHYVPADSGTEDANTLYLEAGHTFYFSDTTVADDDTYHKVDHQNGEYASRLSCNVVNNGTSVGMIIGSGHNNADCTLTNNGTLQDSNLHWGSYNDTQHSMNLVNNGTVETSYLSNVTITGSGSFSLCQFNFDDEFGGEIPTAGISASVYVTESANAMLDALLGRHLIIDEGADSFGYTQHYYFMADYEPLTDPDPFEFELVNIEDEAVSSSPYADCFIPTGSENSYRLVRLPDKDIVVNKSQDLVIDPVTHKPVTTLGYGKGWIYAVDDEDEGEPVDRLYLEEGTFDLSNQPYVDCMVLVDEDAVIAGGTFMGQVQGADYIITGGVFAQQPEDVLSEAEGSAHCVEVELPQSEDVKFWLASQSNSVAASEWNSFYVYGNTVLTLTYDAADGCLAATGTTDAAESLTLTSKTGWLYDSTTKQWTLDLGEAAKADIASITLSTDTFKELTFTDGTGYPDGTDGGEKTVYGVTTNGGAWHYDNTNSYRTLYLDSGSFDFSSASITSALTISVSENAQITDGYFFCTVKGENGAKISGIFSSNATIPADTRTIRLGTSPYLTKLNSYNGWHMTDPVYVCGSYTITISDKRLDPARNYLQFQYSTEPDGTRYPIDPSNYDWTENADGSVTLNTDKIPAFWYDIDYEVKEYETALVVQNEMPKVDYTYKNDGTTYEGDGWTYNTATQTLTITGDVTATWGSFSDSKVPALECKVKLSGTGAALKNVAALTEQPTCEQGAVSSYYHVSRADRGTFGYDNYHYSYLHDLWILAGETPRLQFDPDENLTFTNLNGSSLETYSATVQLGDAYGTILRFTMPAEDVVINKAVPAEVTDGYPAGSNGGTQNVGGDGWQFTVDPDTGKKTLTITGNVELGTDAGGLDASVSVAVYSGGTLTGGVFASPVTVAEGGAISGGQFTAPVQNDGTISGGQFTAPVENNNSITGGTFAADVTGTGTLTGGVFGGDAKPACTIAPDALRSTVRYLHGNAFTANDILTDITQLTVYGVQNVSFASGTPVVNAYYVLSDGTPKWVSYDEPLSGGTIPIGVDNNGNAISTYVLNLDEYDTTQLYYDADTHTVTFADGNAEGITATYYDASGSKVTDTTAPGTYTVKVSIPGTAEYMPLADHTETGWTFTVADPEKPNQPTNPDDPDKPSDPSNPENPDNPDQPSNPENPDNPDQPDKPSDPENPENPSDPGTPDKPASGGGDGGAAVAVAAVGGAALGVGAYVVGTTAYLKSVLPEGVAIPANREQLAVALWTAAGKPAAQSTAVFSDVPAESESLQAIRWAVERGLLTADSNTFNPGHHVTRVEVIRTWNRFQKSGT